MAITTYAELKTALANWTHRDNLTSYLEDIIMTAEKWIFRHARTRDMEASLSVAIASGLATIPSDYVALKHARIDGTPTQKLAMRPADWIYSEYPNRSDASKPYFIAADGANFIFGPFGGSSYTLAGTYYKRLDAVSVSANALFTNNPDLYLFASLAETEPFLKNDKRIAVWQSKRDQILADVNGENQAAHSGDAMQVRRA